MAKTAQKTKIVRALRGGQVTIPAAFRKELGIGEETLLRMTLSDGELKITPVQVVESGEGSPELRALYEYYAPVREEILARGIPEEEVYAVIDEAVAASRRDRAAQRR